MTEAFYYTFALCLVEDGNGDYVLRPWLEEDRLFGEHCESQARCVGDTGHEIRWPIHGGMECHVFACY